MVPVALLVLGVLAPGHGVPSGPVPIVRRDLRHDLSPPLFLIRPGAPGGTISSTHEPLPFPKAAHRAEGAPPLPRSAAATDAPQDFMPAPLLSYPGTGNRNVVSPPDATGDVGPNHYVQWVNLSYAVWDKHGTLLYGPVDGNTIWAGFGGTCETRNNGDPIVLYDPIADRWLLSQLAFFDFYDYHQCIAISQTPDPTGAWYRYDFLFSTTTLNDYPKFGVWPDAYYLAVNQYQGPSRTFAGQGVIAYERDQMLQGLPARSVTFDLFAVNPNYGGALPADLDGPILPPPGAPNPYIEVDDDGFGWTPIDRLSIWDFHVDWSDPASSTFGVGGNPSQVIDLTAAGYGFDSNMCGYSSSCILQPGGARIDALSDRLMYRSVYRRWADHESLTVNHTIDVDGTDHAGVRWYEVDRSGTAWSVAQAGTHAPDAYSRWMASEAMDGSGDLAIAYSVSSTATNPSVRYAGRASADPPGTLPLAETTMAQGNGFQTGLTRWGDYSMLSIDPTDDCTFWATQEYYEVTSPSGWATRIGSFRFPGCVSCGLIGVPALDVSKDAGGTRLDWAPGSNALLYDVVEGSLTVLQSSGGDFSAALSGCPANDLAATTLTVNEPDPAPSDGVFYLVRGVALQCRGTYDDGSASQQPGRDLEGGPAAGCP